MAQPTSSSVQAVDPVLTNICIGYQQADDRFVASKLFPYVPIEFRTGTYYLFTKKYFFTDEMKERAPGAQYAQSGYGVSTATVSTQQYGLGWKLPDEVRSNNQTPMDLEDAGVRYLAQKNLIRQEVEWASAFCVNSVWGTTDNNSTTDWNNYTSSDPVTDVLTARRTISNNTGIDGNTMALGNFVHQALMNHPDIIDRVKFTQMATAQTMENVLAPVFGVSNYWVAKATYSNTFENVAFSATNIFGNNCLVCGINGGPGVFTANPGYSFVWNGGGGQGQILRARNEENEYDLLKIKSQFGQKIVASDLGYLFLTVVA